MAQNNDVYLTKEQTIVCAGIIDAYEDAAGKAQELYTSYQLQYIETLACTDNAKYLQRELQNSLLKEQEALEKADAWYANPFIIGPIGLTLGLILGAMVSR